MTDFAQYRRKQIAELRPYEPGESMEGVSVSAPDKDAGSPKEGDMIARNPKNHEDQWLVAAQYFADNFEALSAGGAGAVGLRHDPLCSIHKGERCDYDCARDYPQDIPSKLREYLKASEWHGEQEATLIRWALERIDADTRTLTALSPSPAQEAGAQPVARIDWNDPTDPVVKLFVQYPVEDYVEEYEWRGDEGDYTPNEQESALLIDAISGVVGDIHEKLRELVRASPPLDRGGERQEYLIEKADEAFEGRLARLTAAGYRLIAPGEIDPETAVEGALKTADSWLERWAKHVGSCEGGDHCTCGLTRVRFEVAHAIRALKQERCGE